jgi:ligand-binding sensor domain-containing protein
MRWWRPDQSPECRQILTMRSTESALLIGGEAGNVGIYARGRWTTETVSRTRRPPEVQSLALDPDSGNLWATTRHGLFQRTAPGRWNRDTNFPGRNVHFLEVWNDGVLALGNNGLYEFAQGAWTPVLIEAESPALSVACVGDTTLALAERSGNGLVLWRRGQRHPERHAVPIGRANCMVWDAQQLWIGNDRGLLRWRSEGLDRFVWDDDDRNHVAALALHQGTLYVGSQRGVWQADTALLTQAGGSLEGVGQSAGLLDGLPHLQVTSLAVHEEEVWVGTQSGLAVLASPGSTRS